MSDRDPRMDSVPEVYGFTDEEAKIPPDVSPFLRKVMRYYHAQLRGVDPSKVKVTFTDAPPQEGEPRIAVKMEVSDD